VQASIGRHVRISLYLSIVLTTPCYPLQGSTFLLFLQGVQLHSPYLPPTSDLTENTPLLSKCQAQQQSACLLVHNGIFRITSPIHGSKQNLLASLYPSHVVVVELISSLTSCGAFGCDVSSLSAGGDDCPALANSYSPHSPNPPHQYCACLSWAVYV
jgi:hypothetical protein